MPLGNPIRKQNESRIVSVLATEGQTVFTVQGGYIINHISVFRNGVRLSNSEDFTAGDGSTVTLNDAANVDDRIEFHIFDRFTVQNAIVSAASTQTISGDVVVNGKIFGNLDVPQINVASGIVTTHDLNVTGIVTATELDLNGKGDISGDLNVVGVTTVGKQIHVGTGISIAAGGINVTAGVSTFAGSISVTGISTLNGNIFLNQSDPKIFFNHGGSMISNANVANTLAFFSDGSTERVRITSAGAILKGLTTGRAQFFHSVVDPTVQIEGAGDFDRQMSILSSSSTSDHGGTLILAHQRSGTIGGNTILQADDLMGMLSYQGHDGTNFIEAARIHSVVESGVGANDMPADLRFSTNSGTTSASEKLRINSSGQVLIGNTASGFASKLIAGTGSGDNGITIYGGTSNNTYLHFADGNSGSDRYRGYVNYYHSDNSMQFGTNDVERVRITAGGKVGIGTDMAGTPASSYGFSVYRASGTGYLYTETAQSSASAGLRAKAGAADFTIFTTQGTGQLSVYDNTNTDERLRLTSAGTVNIGNSLTQTSRLFTVENTLADGGEIAYIGNNDGASNYGGLIISAGETDRECRLESAWGNSFMTFYTNDGSSTEKVRITDGGRVGIGENSPDELLHIKSSAVAGACIELDYGGNYKSQIKTNSDALEVRGPQAINFYTGNNDGASSTVRLNIDNTGRLRINGANTGMKLEMNVNDGSGLGSGSDGFRINSGTPNAQLVRLGTSYSYGGATGSGGASLLYSYDALRLMADTSNPMTFHTAGAIRMHILGNGRVYMGTSSTQQYDQNKVVIGGTKAYSAGIVQQQLTIVDENAYTFTDNGGAIGFQATYNNTGSQTQMACIQGVKENNTNGDYGGAFTISTRQNNGYMNEAIRVGSGGGPTSIRGQLYCNSELNLFRSDAVAGAKYFDSGHLNSTLHFRRTNGGDGGHTVQMYMFSNLLIQGDFNDTSDGKLKTNKVDLADGALSKVNQFKPVTFDWIDSTRPNNQIGFIAQDLKSVVPNLVNGTEYDETETNEKGQIISAGYNVNTIGVVAYLTKALQELSAKNDALEARIAALEGS